MKVLFVDNLLHAADGLDTAPLGGSQSAMIAAATELERRGAKVAITGRRLQSSEYRGIEFFNVSRLNGSQRLDFDIVVTLNKLLSPKTLREAFRHGTRLVHWHQNDALSSYGRMFASAANYSHVDHFVFVSHFQAGSFITRFGMPTARISVIPNPISQPFCDLFAPGEHILAQKQSDLLVYLSAPNRGLEPLLEVLFPALRSQRKGLRLEVYSGFYLDQGIKYGKAAAHDATERYEQLLSRHQASPGVTIQRGVPKSALAQRLRVAAMLCYPCTYRETSCTVAMEAMAAGCQISTSTMGGLPETTAGYAWLTPCKADGTMQAAQFIDNTLAALAERDDVPGRLEEKLRAQVAHVNRNHRPEVMGGMWYCLLRCQIDRTSTAGSALPAAAVAS